MLLVSEVSLSFSLGTLHKLFNVYDTSVARLFAAAKVVNERRQTYYRLVIVDSAGKAQAKS
jgi:hypothetical protein